MFYSVRFHTPEVLKILAEKEQHKETLAAEAQAAFLAFLGEVTESYDVFRTVAENLATLGMPSRPVFDPASGS